MQCVLCHKKPASISLKQEVNGDAKEWHLCTDCAKAQGVDAQLPLPSLTEFLFSLAENAPEAAGDQVCGACHMHLPDFHKTSLLGCPECYGAFEGEVERLIAGMHKDTRHFGKVPKRQLTGFIRALEQAIDAAVMVEDTAGAEVLRRRLRDLVRRTSTRVIQPQAADSGRRGA